MLARQGEVENTGSRDGVVVGDGDAAVSTSFADGDD
jgi:hypothetical protein